MFKVVIINIAIVFIILSACTPSKNYTHTKKLKRNSDVTIVPGDRVVRNSKANSNINQIPHYQFDVSDVSIYAFQSFYDSKTGLYGVADSSGFIVIAAKYDWVRTNPNLTFRVAEKGKVALIDSNNNILIPFGKYQSIDEPHDGMMRALLNNKWGYLDANGNPAILFAFNNANNFNEGRAFVQKDIDGKYAIINKNGILITDFVYECNLNCFFRRGKCKVFKNDKQDIVDLNGNVLFNFEYLEIYSFEDEPTFYWARNKINKWGKLSPKNKLLLPFEYDSIRQTADGKVEVLKDNVWEVK